jgi:subtilisin family serine protease
MLCKQTLLGITLLFSNFLLAQSLESYDQSSYVVEWDSSVNPSDKDRYLDKLNSNVLCEFEFGGRSYAWLEFNSFPFKVGGKYVIDINGGVTPAQSQPEIDNFYFDSKATLIDIVGAQSTNCQPSFDLLAPIGNHPVSIFNLDTGVKLPICDNSNNEFDFCGPINNSSNYVINNHNGEDLNGHGTHGAGLQQNIINASLAEYGGNHLINIENLTVFEADGKGNLGAILCALADVLDDPSPRKVINCSFSFYKAWDSTISDPLFEAFKDLANQNIFSVTSAGNANLDLDGKLKTFPACYFSQDLGDYNVMENSTICIGAADCNMQQAFYSNYSTENVDVSTLGSLYGPDLESGLVKYTGTSQATFASSAIAAILMSNQVAVDLERLKCSIITGAISLNEFNGSNQAGGILSAFGAYEMLFSEEACTNGPILQSNLSALDSGTSIEYNSKQLVNASIFPNPVTDNFTYEVDVQKKGEYTIAIVSSSGKLIDQKTLSLEKGYNQVKFNNALDNGIFYIHFEGQGKMKNSKFVKL